MIRVDKIEEQVLRDFYQLLKVRVNSDPSFMDSSQVKSLIKVVVL